MWRVGCGTIMEKSAAPLLLGEFETVFRSETKEPKIILLVH